MAFGFYSTFTINPGQVPSAQTDFPVLLNPTDNRFKTVANGGHVQDPFGRDLRPYADTSASTAYVFEMVPNVYGPTTGTFEMWVKVPNAQVGSVIYLFYGDPTINTDGSSTATWDSDFAAVYHLANGSVLNVNDSTVNARNADNIPSVSLSGSGQIDGGAAGGGTDNTLRTPAFSAGALTQTLSLWAFASDFSQSAGLINHENVNAQSLLFIQGGNLSIRGGGDNGIAQSAPSNSAWHYIVGTFPTSSTGALYVDGVPGNTGTVDTVVDAANPWDVGGINAGASFAFTGSIDEVRISKIARSADWIKTDYNNQVAPGTFYTIGAEQQVSSATGFGAKQFIGEIQYLGVDSLILDSSMGVN